MLLVAGVVTYFLVSFLMHALPDFLAWWVRYKQWLWQQDQEYERQLEEYGVDPLEQDAPPPLDSFRTFAASSRVHRKTVFAKAFVLDITIPCLVGCFALYFAVAAALQ